MEAVLFIGIQASGKSTFFAQRFFRTHVRINLDMLRTRHRESLLLDACIAGKQPFVVDNTNTLRDERRRFIEVARGAGFRIVGYYFRSSVSESLARNRVRLPEARVPDAGIKGAHARLEMPNLDEGFDELTYVRIDAAQTFIEAPWTNEV